MNEWTKTTLNLIKKFWTDRGYPEALAQRLAETSVRGIREQAFAAVKDLADRGRITEDDIKHGRLRGV